MPRHRRQHRGVLGVAEKLVQRFFRFTQRDAQLIHHASHGLVVAHPAVQLFHPLLKRLRLGTGAYSIQPLGETGCAGLHMVVRSIQLFKSRLEIKHRCSNLHRQSWRWRLS
ncbi:hypothetical protein D3C71_1438620 [compost metagenome]